jgi:glycosidase
LLTQYQTVNGLRHVWTTFSEDQIDLDFSNPAVLTEMIKVFLFYLRQGIRIIRLDAIAFLWKKIRTSCLHLPETHEVVKLLRTIGTAVNPDFLLITETNVPNQENLSYFGTGDEAHMVYQFSLPPLLLYTLFSGNAIYLVHWLSSMTDPGEYCTFLNFTASHDGIGMRPLEGLLPADEKNNMLECMKQFGGRVSLKRNPDGTESVYEINITYFDALKGTSAGLDNLQVNRFLCSQIIMMALKGIPAFYIHSLLATANDYAGMEKTGRLRSINRRKYSDSEIESLLGTENSSQFIFRELKRLIKLRQTSTAFHPNSSQIVHTVDSCFVAFTRSHPETGEKIHCISNISREPAEFDAQSLYEEDTVLFDLIQNRSVDCNEGTITIDSYQTMWLELYPQ